MARQIGFVGIGLEGVVGGQNLAAIFSGDEVAGILGAEQAVLKAGMMAFEGLDILRQPERLSLVLVSL